MHETTEKPTMINDTYELGPMLNTLAPTFTLLNHNRLETSLEMLLGGRGLLLGFIGDIWQPVSVRRILWLQRHIHKFAMMNVSVALLVRDYPHTLYGFQVSNPLPMMFPLLADPDGEVHALYNLERYAGLLLIDRHGFMRHKWLMPDESTWPKQPELVHAIQTLQTDKLYE